ncbi:MAG: hypothetical protein QG549_930 [Patescibacteria group bacterium]|nr:hypothetical protein [Patescibacteria group bacterium]
MMTTNTHHNIINIRLIMTLGVLMMAVIICSFLSTDLKSTTSAAASHKDSVKPHTPLKHVRSTQKPKPIAAKQHNDPSHPQRTTAAPDVHIPTLEDGLAPVVTSLPTKQPVVFLTIDDGAHKTPDELQTMNDNHLVASIFLARLFIADNPLFFADFTKYGSLIENHSLNHYIRPAEIESYELQKQEICGMADYEQQTYGRRPIFFRPPGGAYSVAMQRAAADCGMKAIVTWIAKANGGSMQYQIGDHLRPGDIVLMHFRPEFQQDMRAFLDAMNSQNLHTELLENWMPPAK